MELFPISCSRNRKSLRSSSKIRQASQAARKEFEMLTQRSSLQFREPIEGRLFLLRLARSMDAQNTEHNPTGSENL